MTEHDLDARLRAWYGAQTMDSPSGSLEQRVADIPNLYVARHDRRVWRRPIALMAAAVLLGAALIGGSLAGGFGLVPQSDRTATPSTTEPMLADPATLDACALLVEAVKGTGGDGAGRTFGSDHGLPWAHVCAYGYDGGWNNLHIVIKSTRTSPEEIPDLLADFLSRISPYISGTLQLAWQRERPGRWAVAGATSAPSGDAPSAVAVYQEPYFFFVTARDLDKARAIADGVLAQLNKARSGDR